MHCVCLRLHTAGIDGLLCYLWTGLCPEIFMSGMFSTTVYDNAVGVQAWRTDYLESLLSSSI